MRESTGRIIPMRPSHIPACDEIAALSQPWKSLREGIDFARYVTLKQAYVCVSGRETTGFVIFTAEPVFARGGYLRAIGVAPARRGQGIGRRLMSFAETATARRSPNLYLCVSSFNCKARLFYKGLGYTRVGTVPGLIAPGTSEYIYWKRLARQSRKTRRT
jgi:ribosomal-protein-alanine N-acetyltransferase